MSDRLHVQRPDGARRGCALGEGCRRRHQVEVRPRAASLRGLRRDVDLAGIRRDEVPDQGGHSRRSWGNPDTTKPHWVPTRYVEWTSWRAGAQQWGLSSIRQGESSGTITHEMGHAVMNIGDNNNNPYMKPYHRVGTGTWDMMDRGSLQWTRRSA